MIPTRALTLARTRQWTIREVLQGREVPMSNEEARIRMGNYPTKWHASIAEPVGPAFGQRALQRPLSHQPERAAGCLRLRRASAHEPLWSQPCWPATARLLGLRPRYVKLMRRMQIKTMTFKERRKLFMFNGKRNKQGKFTGHWK